MNFIVFGPYWVSASIFGNKIFLFIFYTPKSILSIIIIFLWYLLNYYSKISNEIIPISLTEFLMLFKILFKIYSFFKLLKR